MTTDGLQIPMQRRHHPNFGTLVLLRTHEGEPAELILHQRPQSPHHENQFITYVDNNGDLWVHETVNFVPVLAHQLLFASGGVQRIVWADDAASEAGSDAASFVEDPHEVSRQFTNDRANLQQYLHSSRRHPTCTAGGPVNTLHTSTPAQQRELPRLVILNTAEQDKFKRYAIMLCSNADAMLRSVRNGPALDTVAQAARQLAAKMAAFEIVARELGATDDDFPQWHDAPAVE